MNKLERHTVTKASRVMLPAYMIFDLLLGSVWTFQSPMRTNAGLAAIRDLWPVPATGVVLLTVAGLLSLAMLLRSRDFTAVLLSLQCITFLALGYIFMRPLQLHFHLSLHLVGVGNPTTSLSGSLWPFFVAVAAFASFLSVIADEYTDATGNRVLQ